MYSPWSKINRLKVGGDCPGAANPLPRCRCQFNQLIVSFFIIITYIAAGIFFFLFEREARRIGQSGVSVRAVRKYLLNFATISGCSAATLCSRRCRSTDRTVAAVSYGALSPPSNYANGRPAFAVRLCRIPNTGIGRTAPAGCCRAASARNRCRRSSPAPCRRRGGERRQHIGKVYGRFARFARRHVPGPARDHRHANAALRHVPFIPRKGPSESKNRDRNRLPGAGHCRTKKSPTCCRRSSTL